MRTFGLIPAAGRSRRMGTPKLLLTLNGKTILEHVVSAVRSAGVQEVVVVVAPDAEDLAQLALKAGAHVARLTEQTPDMRATCQFGLDWIEGHFQPSSADHWLLLPADHPTVRPEVIRSLMQAMNGHSIAVPSFQGRRGHPTLLHWRHVDGIRKMPAGQGLNVYIRHMGVETLEVDWPSEEVLRDLDTPEDYQRLMQ
jgi:molybdenum cofactor cytidylyltransferase